MSTPFQNPRPQGGRGAQGGRAQGGRGAPQQGPPGQPMMNMPRETVVSLIGTSHALPVHGCAPVIPSYPRAAMRVTGGMPPRFAAPIPGAPDPWHGSFLQSAACSAAISRVQCVALSERTNQSFLRRPTAHDAAADVRDVSRRDAGESSAAHALELVLRRTFFSDALRIAKSQHIYSQCDGLTRGRFVVPTDADAWANAPEPRFHDGWSATSGCSLPRRRLSGGWICPDGRPCRWTANVCSCCKLQCHPSAPWGSSGAAREYVCAASSCKHAAAGQYPPNLDSHWHAPCASAIRLSRLDTRQGLRPPWWCLCTSTSTPNSAAAEIVGHPDHRSIDDGRNRGPRKGGQAACRRAVRRTTNRGSASSRPSSASASDDALREAHRYGGSDGV